MNKYIVPYCIIQRNKCDIYTIIARSLQECKDKIMVLFEDYSDKDDWNDFLQELDESDILLGEIKDIEEL